MKESSTLSRSRDVAPLSSLCRKRFSDVICYGDLMRWCIALVKWYTHKRSALVHSIEHVEKASLHNMLICLRSDIKRPFITPTYMAAPLDGIIDE